MRSDALFALFLSLFSTLVNQTAYSQQNPSSVAQLEGTVVDARTRLPIAGAVVRAYPLPDRTGSTVSQTGADGTFRLRLDPTRTYAILTRAEGYNDLEEKLAFSDQRAERLYGKQIRLEPGTPPKATPPVVLPTIQFAPRRYDLSSEAMTTLREVAAQLTAHPTVRIEAAGHTDTIGDIALNRQLGLERAEAVRTFLFQLGIAQSRVEIRSYGGTKPLPGPLTPERRAKNKRVELRVL